MLHQSFLLVMSQLASKRKARVTIQNEEIFFQATEKKNHYVLYTKVYSGDGYLPSQIRSMVSSSGVLRWQQSGAYLKLDPLTYSVFLFQEVQMEEGKYIPFKRLMNDFCEVSAEWREILKSFAEKDLYSSSI